MKVDLCTWTKNGAKTLPPVLKRIDEVIPSEDFGKKIAVDDSSTDDTRLLLKDFNWEVYDNREGFICGGTREALRHVQLPFFVSVEQDVLLNPEWWNVIPSYLENNDVAVAQGVELPMNRAERAMMMMAVNKSNQLPFQERSKKCYSIGNNMYRTEIVRKTGFVTDKVSMGSFYDKVMALGYNWITDTNMVSAHLHGGFFDGIYHNTRFYALTEEKTWMDAMTISRFLAGLGMSPLKGLQFVLKSREPSLLLYYPLQRLLVSEAYFARRWRI